MKGKKNKKTKLEVKSAGASIEADAASIEQKKREETNRVYKLGFWVFFFLALFSVVFSVWAISSIYSSFQVVTKILGESFERTNMVMDITSGKITSCEQKLKDCPPVSGSTAHVQS